MNTKAAFLLVSVLVVLPPFLLWRIRAVRRAVPLAVAQILVGVALGPTLFGRLAPDWHGVLFARPVLSLIDGASALGVLLYVFCTGLHLHAGPLRRDAARLGTTAAGSVLLPLALGTVAGGLLLHALPGAAGPAGGGAGFVASVAICVAVTALPVLAAVLGELELLHARIGQTALALAALNDAALWVMLAVLLAATGTAGTGTLFDLLLAAGWFAGLFLLGPRVLRVLPGLGEAGQVVGAVALALLSAGVSEALGTGYLIGAFAAGVAVPANSRATLLARLELVTATVLLPFFFMSTGLKARIDPASGAFLLTFGATVLATVAGKLVGTALPARRAGFSWPDAVSLGAMMQTKGLMEVVVLAALHDAGMIGTEVFSGMVAMAVFCTVITAPAVRWCGRAGTAGVPEGRPG